MLRCGSWRSRLLAGQPNPCFCRARTSGSHGPTRRCDESIKDHCFIVVSSFPVLLLVACKASATWLVEESQTHSF